MLWHICTRTGINIPRWSVGLQVILIMVQSNFLIDKIREILDMEENYNFLYKWPIKKILIPREESAGIITEEDFGRRKYHRTVEVDLCICLLGQTGADSMTSSIRINIICPLLKYCCSLCWIYIHTIMASTCTKHIYDIIDLINYDFFLGTVFGYLEVIKGGTIDKLFQELCQGNERGMVF